MKKLVVLSLLLSLISCSNSKTVSENSLDENLYRFSVSFYSIGTGIDVKAKQSYMAFLTDFETKSKTKISYETAQWGKEGEVDLCFKLTELNKKGQLDFIKESKENLRPASYVSFKENEVCR